MRLECVRAAPQRHDCGSTAAAVGRVHQGGVHNRPETSESGSLTFSGILWPEFDFTAVSGTRQWHFHQDWKLEAEDWQVASEDVPGMVEPDCRTPTSTRQGDRRSDQRVMPRELDKPTWTIRKHLRITDSANRSEKSASRVSAGPVPHAPAAGQPCPPRRVPPAWRASSPARCASVRIRTVLVTNWLCLPARSR